MRVFFSLFILLTTTAANAEDKEKVAAGWRYAHQIKCEELAYSAKLYDAIDLHKQKAQIAKTDALSSGLLSEVELQSYRVHALGEHEGMRLAFSMLQEDLEPTFRKFYKYIECE
ncbi:hypothetical protein FLL83_18235 [Vibrio cholerae]|uniref:hypothetical protein n=1 Tax=Vibrio cholerae TaxID=666 RepID=UPI001157C26F|nr:hypothetical protein [Vibrio cholerae]TQQ58599.1 hypothetical protein FLL83_18235 [Vibrio cholerae]